MNTIHNPSSLDAPMPIELHTPVKEINKSTAFEEGVFYLGDVGALIFFAHSALQSVSNTKELGWALQLQEAIVYLPSKYRQPRISQALQKNLPPDPTIAKPQISKWKSANPFVIDFPVVSNDRLAYRVLTVRVSGVTNAGGKWIGHVIFILEMNTNTFFFCYIDANKSPVITLELLQKSIHEADDYICKKRRKKTDLNYKKEVWLPGDFTNDELDACDISFKEAPETTSDVSSMTLHYPSPFSFMANALTQEPTPAPTKQPIKKLKNWRGRQYKMENSEYIVNVKVPDFHKAIYDDTENNTDMRQYVIGSGIQFADSLSRIVLGMNALYVKGVDVSKNKDMSEQEKKLKKRRRDNCKNIDYSACIGLNWLESKIVG